MYLDVETIDVERIWLVTAEDDPRWDPDRYLAFADERSRPFAEMLARIPGEPRRVADLGCGPGHLSRVLRARWPRARITGIDSSPEMIGSARADHAMPGVSYELCDITGWDPAESFDLVISNAALQWVPGHLDVVTRLRSYVAPRGSLAVQVPNNHDEPSHRLLRELAARDRYASHTRDVRLPRGADAETYLDLLSAPGWTVDAWETTYLHVLQGPDPVFTWISGTGARPVLQALPGTLRELFVAEYTAALREVYPERPYGTVLRFPRTFVVATRR